MAEYWTPMYVGCCRPTRLAAGCCNRLPESGIRPLSASDSARSRSLSAHADQGLFQPRCKQPSYSTETPSPSPALLVPPSTMRILPSAFPCSPRRTTGTPPWPWSACILLPDLRNGLQARRGRRRIRTEQSRDRSSPPNFISSSAGPVTERIHPCKRL